MKKLIELIKLHQQTIVLSVAFIIVAGISFCLGQQQAWKKSTASEIQVNETATAPDNYNATASGAQTPPVSTTPASTAACVGQIKGSSSMIYHLPGGAFYDKTTKPIQCFDTEAQAQAAGFRKSSR